VNHFESTLPCAVLSGNRRVSTAPSSGRTRPAFQATVPCGSNRPRSASALSWLPAALARRISAARVPAGRAVDRGQVLLQPGHSESIEGRPSVIDLMCPGPFLYGPSSPPRAPAGAKGALAWACPRAPAHVARNCQGQPRTSTAPVKISRQPASGLRRTHLAATVQPTGRR
jgi:hypothetical protein